MTKIALKDQIYRSYAYLVFDITVDEANSFLRKHGYEESWHDGSTGMLVSTEEKGCPVHYIFIPKRGVDPETLGALGHEVLHLTFAVLKNSGIAYSSRSEEAYTYFFQTMFQQCVEIFRRRRKK